MHRYLAAVTSVALLIAGSQSSAQTIYPIDRAEILAGATFDFKVEFSGLADPAKIAVSINGEDYTNAFGKAGTFIAREDGQEHICADSARRFAGAAG
jgi:alkaline phosphatase